MLPLLLLVAALVAAFFLFRDRLMGITDADATNVETTAKEVPVVKRSEPKPKSPTPKESASVAATSPKPQKSETLLPPKIRKQTPASTTAPVQPVVAAPVASTTSAGVVTAVPRAGPSDSEARAIIDNLETNTPTAEQPPSSTSVVSTSDQVPATATPAESADAVAVSGASGGSDDEVGGGGKKKKKSKSKKSKHKKSSKKDGKDKKKKKKSVRLEAGAAAPPPPAA